MTTLQTSFDIVLSIYVVGVPLIALYVHWLKNA
jgi:hypothetical protein